MNDERKEVHGPLSRSITFGSAFDISAGQSVTTDGYTLSAVSIPAAHQGAVRLQRPSGVFSISRLPSHEEVTFTLHGDRNFFCFTNMMVHLIKSRGNTARCVIWPTPSITDRVAEEIAWWASREDGYFTKNGNEKKVRVRSHNLQRPVRGEDGPVWEVILAAPFLSSHVEYCQTVVIDAVSGAILSPAHSSRRSE